MKIMLRLFRAKPRIAASHSEAILDETVDAVREAATSEAAAVLASIAHRAYVPANAERQRLCAEGIVDGWFASDAYDPAIAIGDVVHGAYRLQAERLAPIGDIWNRAAAELDGRAIRRTETGHAIGVAEDSTWCWEHSDGLARADRMPYGRAVGLGIAYGLSITPVRGRIARGCGEIRKTVQRTLSQGRYVKTMGLFEKRNGLFDMDLTEAEWNAKRLAA